MNQKLGKFTKILFVVFVFLLPIQTIWMLREVFVDGEKWQYGTIGIYMTDVVLVLVLLLYGGRYLFMLRHCESAKQSKTPLKILDRHVSAKCADGIFLWLVAFIVWSFLSVFWAQDSLLAFYSATKIALGAVAFMLAWSLSAKYMKWALVAIMIMAVLQSAVGIGQFIAQYSPEVTFFGMNKYEPYAAGVSVVKTEGARWLRAYGTLSHPNMLGGYLVVALTASISYFVFRISHKSKIENRKLHRRLFIHAALYGSCVIILLGLLLTFSRMAWLGFGMAFMVMAYIAWRTREKGIQKRFAKGAIVLVASGALFAGILHETIFPRFDASTIVREGSVSERAQSLRDGYAIISQYPFIGVGAGNMTAAVRENTPAREIWSLQPAHSVPILMWSELGVVGVGFFGIFLFLIVRNVVRGVQSGVQKASFFGITALITALIPAFFFDHWLWTSHFGIVFLCILLGLTVRKVA